MMPFSPDMLSLAYLAASSDDVGDLFVKIATAVGILLGGLAGWRLKARNADETELKALRRENVDLRADLLAMVGYSSSVQITLAQQGIALPDPPHLKSQDKDAEK